MSGYPCYSCYGNSLHLKSQDIYFCQNKHFTIIQVWEVFIWLSFAMATVNVLELQNIFFVETSICTIIQVDLKNINLFKLYHEIIETFNPCHAE